MKEVVHNAFIEIHVCKLTRRCRPLTRIGIFVQISIQYVGGETCASPMVLIQCFPLNMNTVNTDTAQS